jgi:hypothetical protein
VSDKEESGEILQTNFLMTKDLRTLITIKWNNIGSPKATAHQERHSKIAVADHFGSWS